MIHRRGQRYNPVGAYSTISWLATGDAAVRGGPCDGAAGLRAERTQAHAAPDRGCRTAAGTAGGALQAPRIARRRRIEACVLRGDRFADEDSAGLAQALHYG